MNDTTHDEVNRYDRLSPEARALVDDYDECDLAEMLVAKKNDIASCNAQQWPQRLARAEAAIARVRTLAEQWQASVRPGEPHPAAQAVLAALKEPAAPAAAQAADGPACRYCGADCSNGRSWDGGNLHACGPCAGDRATINRAGGDFDALVRRVRSVDSPATEATVPHTGLVVEPYRNDRGEQAWVFRCWGSDSCDGWLSLDHTSQQSAERARDRHVTEEHAEPGELTADEARGLVDELGLDLYRAQDALAFVGECCTIAEHEQRPITTADVREWLKGARCGRQLAADAAAATEPATVTDPGYLRQQYTAIIGALHDNRPDHIATELLLVRDRHLQQLRQRLRLADELLATRDAELAAAKKTARGIGAWGVLQAIEQVFPQGPTVAEAAADDARWPLEKHGE